jgi:hypothetical protein
MTNKIFPFVLITILITFKLIDSSNFTSDLKNVSSTLNDLLKSYDRYHRPTYGGLHLS